MRTFLREVRASLRAELAYLRYAWRQMRRWWVS
jgi:hypothetical protein